MLQAVLPKALHSSFITIQVICCNMKQLCPSFALSGDSRLFYLITNFSSGSANIKVGLSATWYCTNHYCNNNFICYNCVIYWDVRVLCVVFFSHQSHLGTRSYEYFLCNCSVADRCSLTVSFIPVHHSLSYVTSTAGRQSVQAAMKIDATECNVGLILTFVLWIVY